MTTTQPFTLREARLRDVTAMAEQRLDELAQALASVRGWLADLQDPALGELTRRAAAALEELETLRRVRGEEGS